MPEATVHNNGHHIQPAERSRVKLHGAVVEQTVDHRVNSDLNSDLFVETEDLQELDRQEQTGLVVLVADVEESLQVSAAQRVQHSPVHQMSLEALRVLGQTHVTQPGR